jgi:hypothetical protein
MLSPSLHAEDVFAGLLKRAVVGDSADLSAMSVAKGVVTLTGQESLNGLGVTLTPTWDNAYPRSGLG